MTSNLRTTRPATRAIAIDWTAWGGIGMATRGSIPKMMELARIDMLPPEAGIPMIRRELTAGGTRGEVVIGQRLGVLGNDWDVSGGLDTDAATSTTADPMIGRIVSAGIYDGVTIETSLDPAVQPFLHDHQIDGTPVLPGVMGIEAFAEAATCILPGWHIESIEDINFVAPFKFYRSEPRTLTIQATLYSEGEYVTADCRLIGRRQLPGQAEPQVTTHFSARVRLTQRPVPAVVAQPEDKAAAAGSMIEGADIYRVYFHGPAYRVLKQARWDEKHIVGQMAEGLPANHEPRELPLLVSPRLIELCFQTAGLWEISRQHRFGLPLHVERITVMPAAEEVEHDTCAIVTPHPEQGSFDAEVVDSTGKCFVRMTGYRTVALPGSVNLEAVHALQVA
jgi:hypothetical protein